MSEISISVTQEELCIERLEDLGNGLVGVDGQLKVCGIQHLCMADGSIMPRVTTGNTWLPA